VRVRYLHSDVDTLRRVELLTELRAGVYDVLVGINLLREGLDLPEVSLVAILDADKEGFLRSGTSLIQTIGRAARNVSGEVHMYASKVTRSMAHAIGETDRRRDKQLAYNALHGIDPTPLRKKIADITSVLARERADTEELIKSHPGSAGEGFRRPELLNSGPEELSGLIATLTDQMMQASGELKFELAGKIRDELLELKKELRQILGAQG
jgi:excinuclease ABC subunit B